MIIGNYIAGNGADTDDTATPGPTGINISSGGGGSPVLQERSGRGVGSFVRLHFEFRDSAEERFLELEEMGIARIEFLAFFDLVEGGPQNMDQSGSRAHHYVNI